MTENENLFKRISKIGAYPLLSIGLTRRIVLSNQVALVIICGAAPFYVLFNLAGASLLGDLVIPIILSWLSCIYLNYKRQYDLSRALIVISPCVYIIVYATALGRESGIQLITFSLLAMGMVMIDPKRKVFRNSILAFPIMTFVFLELIDYTLFPRVVIPSLYLKLSYLIIVIVTFFILYYSIRFYFDISEEYALNLKKANEELKESLYDSQKQRNILEKVSQQSAFTTLSMGIAHEIRNPMFNLLARAEIIEEEPTNEQEVLKFVEMIKRNISRILNITNTMLKYGNPAMTERGRISIKRVLTEIVEIIKGKCLQKQIKINLDLDDVPMIYVDGNQIYQALMNLIINAIESINSGNGELSISLHESTFKAVDNREMKGIAVVIKDTGEGITPEIRASIFNPFFTTKYKNTGLGLAITLKNIHAHDGLVSLESEPGKGSAFTVYLPL